MTIPRDWLPTDWLSVAADVLGIIGFGLTIYVFQTARNIQRQYQRRLLLPKLVEEFEQVVEEVATMLDATHSASMEARLQVDTIAVRAREIRKLVTKPCRLSLDEVLNDIEKYKSHKTLTNIQDVYLTANKAFQELKSEVRGNLWEP